MADDELIGRSGVVWTLIFVALALMIGFFGVVDISRDFVDDEVIGLSGDMSLAGAVSMQVNLRVEFEPSS